jgi:hypothetical protein
MNRRIVLSAMAGLTGLGLASLPGHADSKQLSSERLDMLDQRGYFTPDFKAAVHDLVNARHALELANAEKLKLTKDLPDLQSQAAEAEAKAVALRRELANYEHPEETDFDALQNRMNDAAAKPEEQIMLAQAYVWTYPASPHQGEAQQYLQQVQKKIADLKQAEKDAETARVAARAEMVQRAQAKDLSLSEWRDFLRDMSQDDLVKLIGRPTAQTGDYWTYSGDWILDTTTHRKVGMEINFNAGRVLSVSEKPSPP